MTGDRDVGYGTDGRGRAYAKIGREVIRKQETGNVHIEVDRHAGLRICERTDQPPSSMVTSVSPALKLPKAVSEVTITPPPPLVHS